MDLKSVEPPVGPTQEERTVFSQSNDWEVFTSGSSGSSRSQLNAMVRVERLRKPKVSMGVITNASPLGWGAILIKVEEGAEKRLLPIEAVEC